MKTIIKICAGIIIILLSKIAFSQQDTILLKELQKPIINCETVAVNSQRIISSLTFYNQDSILKVLNAWEDYCGENEPILRMKILFDIKNKKDISVLFEKYMNYNYKLYTYYSENYKRRINESEKVNSKTIYTENSSYFNYVPLNGNYDTMTESFAQLLLKSQQKSSLSYLFCEFISGDFDKFDNDIYSEDYADNETINNLYGKKYEHDYMYSLGSGVWLPQGQLANVFNPSFQLRLTVASPKFFNNNFDVETSFSARIITDEASFNFKDEDSVYIASCNAGFNFGLNLVYEKEIGKKMYLRLFSGIAADWLSTNIKTPETAEKDNNDASYYYITTYCVPFGTGIRRNIFHHNTIGIDLTYNFTRYNIDKKLITDLNGDALTISLFYGF